MADPITLDQEELQRIANVQQVSQNITVEFGSIHLAKLALQDREERANANLEALKEAEQDLVKSLSEKYGDGSINLQDGTFEPAPGDNVLPNLNIPESEEEDTSAK